MSQVVTTELVIDARPAEAGAQDYARAMDKAAASADKARGAEAKLQEKIDEARSVQSRAATLVAERSNAYERLRAKIDPVVALEQRMARATSDADRAVRSGQATQAQATATLEAYRLKQQQLLGILPKVAAANENAAAKARAGWAALTEQGVAQGKAVQLAERQAAAWRALSAQGAAQAQSLAGLKGANDNATAAFAAQSTQIGSLLPSYSTLITLVGALGAAYVAGKFIQTVTSFQAIDASLKAATGSTEAAQSALAFVRAESDRLGLSLGSTAKDFASFAASTRGTELEGEKARKVFSSIAEAGTVLGLSADDMSGALLALSQMASKGTVSSEELRGQLGERLPGAFNIAAKAMGVTTAELGKMLEQGQVLASDFLPKFADEMHRVFGPEAANASKNLQANLNRLQTAILDLFLAAGKGGLTEALNDAVRQATGFLKSSQDMAGSAGGALATGLRAAGAAFQFLRDNSTAAGVALAAVIALRFGPSVIEIVAAVARAVAMMGVYDVATRQLVVSQTAAVASSRALSIAMGAIGGPIGLALTAATAGIAYLVLRQDEGTKAAQTQAAALRTLDEALVQNKGSLIGASEETKRLAAEQLAAAQAAVEAARKRLAEAETKAADTSPQIGVAGFEAFYASADRAVDVSFQLGAAQADLDDKTRRLGATTNLVAGNLTAADAAVLGFGSSVSQSAAQVDAAIPSMIKYGDAMAKLIAMVPQLQQAVDTQNKVAAAKGALDTAISSAGEAHLRGEISFKQMVESGNKARETYKLATEEVTGFAAASKKLDTEARSAAVAAMDARAGAIAKLKDEHAALVQSYKEGSASQMSEAQRTELVSRAEAVLAQKVANTNKEFDEREAKKAGAAATKEAGKAAREAAREFDGFEKQADAAFKKLFPEEALRKKGQELQALLDKYEERLAKIDPRLVESMKTTIKFNLDGKEVEGVKHKTDELATEMSQTFRGVFDDMFTNAGKGLDGLLDSITKGFSRIGSRLVEKNLIEPLFSGKGGEGGGSGGFLGFSLSDLRSTFRDGFGQGFDDTFGPLLEPAKNSKGESMGFGSSKLGAGLTAGLAGASIGYSTQNPLIGAVGGGLAGFAAGAAAGGTMGPIGAVIGAGAGLIGGLLGKAQAKKAAAKRLKEQLEAYKEAYREAEPEIKKLEATFRGGSVGNVGGQVDAAFQQAVAANKTASQAGDQPRADSIMQDFVKYAWRLRDVFMNAFEGTLAEVSAGFGTSGPFAQANAAVATLGESLKAFVEDSKKLPEAESNSARARAAAQQAALASLDPPKALSDTQTRLAAIQGTAAGLSRVLQDLGMSADEAAAAIRDRTTKAMAVLRAEFSANLQAKTNEATGKGYLNEVADLVKEREGLLADARAIGAGTGDVAAYFKAAAQKIVDGSELTGDAFTALVKRFPELRGAVVEFGQAVDSAAVKAAAAARATGYADRLFAAGNDANTLAGALAAQERKAAADRLAEQAAGGQKMAELEKALGAEQAAIRKQFAEQAAAAEAAAREAGQRRVVAAEDRLFAARNDTSTLAGKLAEIDRRHAQERLAETDADGRATAKLLEAQAAERLKIVREAGAAEVAARKAALAEAQTFLDGASKNIRTYLDGLKAGSETNLSPGARLKEAQAQFDRQLKLAKGGDRDALGSITSYADRLLDAGKGQFASGKGYQDILGSVTKQLGGLPKQLSAQQFIVDAIKAQTTDLKTVIATGSAAEIAKALKGDFTGLDTNTDGLLSQKEFLAALGPKATVAEQQKALLKFAEIDLNGDGQLSKLELLIAETKGGLAAAKASEVAKALLGNFNKLDTNTNGLLSQKEFLTALGPKATVAEQQAALAVFREIDLNGDGQLSKLELSRAQLKGAIEANSPALIQKALSSDFTKLDKNVDGLLSPAEFLAGLNPLATASEQAAAMEWFKAIDANGDGQLSKLELMRGQMLTALKVDSPQAMATAIKTNFPKLDINKDGLLSSKEFLNGLGPLAGKKEQQDALAVFRSIDLDGDGQISKLEALRVSLGSNLTGINAVTKAVGDNFGRLDKNGSGGLSLKEFKAAFGGLATQADQKLAEEYFKNIDADGDKVITKMELTTKDLLAGIKKNSPTDIASALKNNFPTIDVNSDGGITYAEMVTALGPKATKADQEAAKKVFDEIDKDGDKIVTKAEAVRFELLAQLKANDPSKMGAAIASSFKTIDLNADAKIDWSEYVKAVGPATKAEQAAAKAVFDRIDADGNGVITAIEAANAAIAGAVKANSASAFATALNTNFSTLDRSVNGILDKAELQDAIKGLSTVAEQKTATNWIKELDTNGDGQLTQAELTAGRLFDLKGLTSNTTKAVNDNKAATDTATTAVKDGTAVAKDSKAFLDAIKGFASDQKALLNTIKGYQETAKDTLGEIKSQSGTQKTQLELLNKQYTLAKPVAVPGTTQVLSNNMLDALNKIVYNTGMTVNGLIKLMSTNRPDGLLFAFASGGWVRGPGSGTSDSVRARLSNGEFVVNAAAARLNAPLLEAMNDNRPFMPAMAVPVPMASANDNGSMLAALQQQIALLTRAVAVLEHQLRLTKEGDDRQVRAIEDVADEVAGSREDNRRAAAPMRSGRGEQVKAA